MLRNEYLDAKIGVDTAENEPSKVCFYLVLSVRTIRSVTILRTAEPYVGRLRSAGSHVKVGLVTIPLCNS
jgi:hypothetical protein